MSITDKRSGVAYLRTRILGVRISDELVRCVMELEHVAPGAELCGGAHGATPAHPVDTAAKSHVFFHENLYSRRATPKKLSHEEIKTVFSPTSFNLKLAQIVWIFLKS